MITTDIITNSALADSRDAQFATRYALNAGCLKCQLTCVVESNPFVDGLRVLSVHLFTSNTLVAPAVAAAGASVAYDIELSESQTTTEFTLPERVPDGQYLYVWVTANTALKSGTVTVTVSETTNGSDIVAAHNAAPDAHAATYTVATLPTPVAALRGVVKWCTDCLTTQGTGGAVVCDGAKWVTVCDGVTSVTEMRDFVKAAFDYGVQLKTHFGPGVNAISDCTSVRELFVASSIGAGGQLNQWAQANGQYIQLMDTNAANSYSAGVSSNDIQIGPHVRRKFASMFKLTDCTITNEDTNPVWKCVGFSNGVGFDAFFANDFIGFTADRTNALGYGINNNNMWEVIRLAGTVVHIRDTGIRRPNGGSAISVPIGISGDFAVDGKLRVSFFDGSWRTPVEITVNRYSAMAFYAKSARNVAGLSGQSQIGIGHHVIATF